METGFNMQEEAYHIPVLLTECLDALQIDPAGTYVDCTFGGGGHSRAILEKLGPDGRLVAFDQMRMPLKIFRMIRGSCLYRIISGTCNVSCACIR